LNRSGSLLAVYAVRHAPSPNSDLHPVNYDMQALLAASRPASALSSLTAFRSYAALPAPLDAPAHDPLPVEHHTEQGMYRDLIVPLYNLNKQQIGSYTLGGDVFDVPIRKDILHRVVRWQLARRQQGTHKTKTRSEVRGGGRKPRPQKGSGRARAGTIRAPQWRGGGVAHGPVPRSHEHKLFKRVRRLGLKCALSTKVWERRFAVVDTLQPADHKTVSGL
jgi:large subunit ribosomal protein L4